MVASDQIRREASVAGGAPANSSVGTLRETARSGRATEDTLILVMPLEGGGEVRFVAVHGRVEMQIRVGKQRSWLTTPVSDRRAREYGDRLIMISDLAFAQRQAKGA